MYEKVSQPHAGRMKGGVGHAACADHGDLAEAFHAGEIGVVVRVARGIARTEAYVTSRRERKKIEMLFAHLKRILRLDRLRLRGPNGARDEFHLAAAAQNLRKLAKLIPMPQPLLA